MTLERNENKDPVIKLGGITFSILTTVAAVESHSTEHSQLLGAMKNNSMQIGKSGKYNNVPVTVIGITASKQPFCVVQETTDPQQILLLSKADISSFVPFQ